MRKLIMVCGPYSGISYYHRDENIKKARDAAIALWIEGYDVFCPHMNTAHFDGVCDDRVFLDYGLRMLEICDAVYMMNGWQNSPGSFDEHFRALQLGKQIIYQE